jgi:hypothetical protein
MKNVEGIKNWRSTDGEALINKLKGTITVLHREFAERIGNALTGFQLTFDTSESKEEMDLRRHAVVTTMLLDDSFLDGHLEVGGLYSRASHADVSGSD